MGLKHVLDVIRDAIWQPKHLPLTGPNGDTAQREQVMRSAERVEEKSRESLRRSARAVRDAAAGAIRTMEGRKDK